MLTIACRREMLSTLISAYQGNRLITRFSANELVDAEAAASRPTTAPTDAFAALESLVSAPAQSRDEYIQVAGYLDDVTSPLNASGHVDAAWQAGGDDLDVATSPTDPSDDFEQLAAAFGMPADAKVHSVKAPGSHLRPSPTSPQQNRPSETITVPVRRQAPMPLVKPSRAEVIRPVRSCCLLLLGVTLHHSGTYV